MANMTSLSGEGKAIAAPTGPVARALRMLRVVLVAIGHARRARHAWLYGLVVTLVVVLAGWQLSSSREVAYTEARAEAVTLARLTAEHMASELDVARVVVDVIAGQLPAAALQPQTHAQHRAAITSMLRSQKRLLHEVSALRVFSAAGDTLFSSEEGETPVNIADRSFFRQVRDDPRIAVLYTEVVYGRYTGRSTSYVQQTLRTPDGAFAGVVVAAFDLAAVQASFRALDLGQHGAVALRRTDNGALVVRYPGALDVDNRPEPDLPIRRLVASGHVQGAQELISTVDGETRIAAYQQVGTHPFYVAVAVSPRDFLAAWQRAALWMLVLAALILPLLTWAFAALATAQRRLRLALDTASANAQRFRGFIEQNDAAILLIDGESGAIVDANASACRFYGWSRDEMIRMDIGTINCLVADEVAQARAAAMAGERNHFVFEHQVANGTVHMVEVHATPVHADGRALLVSIVHDVTERHRLSAELDRLLAEQAAIIGSPVVGLVKVRERHMVWMNEAFAAMFGYRIDQLVGQPTRLLYESDEDHADFARQAGPVLARREVHEVELAQRRADGSRAWFHVSCAALSEDGLTHLGAFVDVTCARRLEQELATSRQALAELYDLAPCAYYSLDAQGKFLRVNRTLAAWVGVPAGELIGRHGIADFFGPWDRERFDKRFPQFVQGEAVHGMEFDLRAPGAAPRHVSVNAEPVRDEAGRFVISRSIMFDISALHQARETLLRLTREQEAMLDNDMVAMVKLQDRRAVWFNQGLERMTGFTREELTGQSARMLYADEASFQAFGLVAYRALAEGGRYRGQTPMRHKDGRTIWVDATGIDLAGSPGVSLWMLVDVSDSHARQLAVERLAFHDPLTGLPNRLLLADRILQALALARRHQRRVAVCYLDLDGFKAVNDTAGHAAGDALLVEVGRRLVSAVRGHDTVGRVGGDEFVLVLSQLEPPDAGEAVLARVAAALHEPFEVAGVPPVRLGVSIGVAVYPDDGDEPDVLMRHADQAMYRAKQAGRGRVHHFGGRLQSSRTDRRG